MIITRAPLRISFAGGGTDIPQFYEQWPPGAVVSTAINKYVYVTLSEKFNKKVSVRYCIHENVDSARDLKHCLVREALLKYGILNNVEIVIISEAPARGSGLGASSSLAVALCAALECFTQKKLILTKNIAYKYYLAEMASYLEIDLVKSPIGKQDQYASAFGGLNLMRFKKAKCEVIPFELQSFIDRIESYSMLFYLDMEHEYSDSGNFMQRILKDQIHEIEKKKSTYQLHRDNALQLWESMQYGQIECFAGHVNENWRIKKTLHPNMSNSKIDDFMNRAYANGAIAAKVCGAGGGGFAYFMVPPKMQDFLRKEFCDYEELPCSFNEKGVEIIYRDNARIANFYEN